MTFKHTLVVVMMALAVVTGGAAVGVAQEAPPGDPASFYGTVTDGDGTPAPEGTTIYAVAIDSNGDTSVEASITVDSAGEYGGADATDEKLRVDSNAGEEVRFHVGSADGPQSDETYPLEAGVYEEDLTFSDADFGIDALTLELGASQLEVDGTTDATVTAEYDDGSTEDVTDQVTIESSDSGVASVNGVTVTAESLGTATLSTEYLGESASAEIEVVEEVAEEDGDTGGQAGGGGGQPADDEDGETVDEPASKTIALAGTNPEVRVDGGESISMIGFGSQVELDDTVTITELTESPAPAPQGAAFVIAADITFSSTNGEGVDTVQMGVQQSTLDELGVSSNQLGLHHLNEDGEWEALETEVAYEDKFEVVLEAPSAGFSTYAVFAQEDVTTTTTTQEPTTEEPTTEEPTTTEKPPTTTETPDEGGPGALLIGGIFVVVLALLAALYLAFGRE